MLSFSDYKDKISQSVHYHIENNIPFAENIYRVHSEEFYKLFREARELYNEGLLTELTSWDKTLLETDIGEFGDYFSFNIFMIRFIAGIGLGILYCFRGFGLVGVSGSSTNFIKHRV